MLSHQPPAVGAFVRPVGRHRFLYCLEVLCVGRTDHAGVPVDQWHCRRWALDDAGRPLDDGLRDGTKYLSGLVRVLPGVWRDDWRGSLWGAPLYYRLMASAQPAGQGELFAEAA